MKLSKWAKQQGITYRTAWSWFKNGTLGIPSKMTESGTILVFPQETELINNKTEIIYIYGRVSSYEKKKDLESQIKICEDFCLTKGWIVNKSFKEIASGMNDNRKILNKILETPPTKLVILYKDRLTRFGFNYIKLLLSKLGCEIIVIHEDKEDEKDILKDFVAIITRFCCRLYGAKRGQSKALKMKEELNKNNE
jgi:predicted site-specific integrase-resolvase